MIQLKGLQSLVRKGIAESKVSNPQLWMLSAAYLAYMDNNLPEFRKYLTRAESMGAADAKVNAQVHTLHLLLKLNDSPDMNPAFEQSILPDLVFLEKSNPRENYGYDFNSFLERLKWAEWKSKSYSDIMLIMSHRYRQHKDFVKTTLYRARTDDQYRGNSFFYELQDNASMAELESLKRFFNQAR